MQVQLTDRQQHILWATVRHHCHRRASGFKSSGRGVSVSAQLIRNAMGVLEKVGLHQPHLFRTVPSDSGYRIYVDQLITPSDILTPQLDTPKSDLDGRIGPGSPAASANLGDCQWLHYLITMPQAIPLGYDICNWCSSIQDG